MAVNYPRAYRDHQYDLQVRMLALAQDTHQLDLTQNAIEGLEDIRALLDRAAKDKRQVDIIILTRQQIEDIDSDKIANTIFGKKVIVR